MSTENDRLEDLSAQLLSRSAFMTSEQLSGFRVSIARMEGKLDAALALREDFEDFEEKTDVRVRALELKVTQLEGFKAVSIWVAGLVGMLMVGCIGTLFAFILNGAAK